MTPLQSFLTCVRIRATSARATGRKGGASGGAQSPPGWRPAARVRAPRRHWRGLGGLGRPRGLARGRGGAATQPRPRRAPRHRASSGRVGRAPPGAGRQRSHAERMLCGGGSGFESRRGTRQRSRSGLRTTGTRRVRLRKLGRGSAAREGSVGHALCVKRADKKTHEEVCGHAPLGEPLRHLGDGRVEGARYGLEHQVVESFNLELVDARRASLFEQSVLPLLERCELARAGRAARPRDLVEAALEVREVLLDDDPLPLQARGSAVSGKAWETRQASEPAWTDLHVPCPCRTRELDVCQLSSPKYVRTILVVAEETVPRTSFQFTAAGPPRAKRQ